MKLRLIALALLAAPAMAQPFDAPFSVGSRGYGRLQEAVDAIGEGSGTIVIAPGNHADCAVQTAGRVTYAAAQPGTAVFDGVTCEGKAALVLRGRSARVEGLTFRNMAVPDKNGAGIRLEQGDLDIVESLFADSENGILTAEDRSGAIRIDRSTFSGLGQCRSDNCSHSIYIGNYGSVSVTRVRFERGQGGHYLKSRAARIDLRDSSFDDSKGHRTNYMVDLSNGATGTISGNVFVQGPDKENRSALIMIAAEGEKNSSAGLSITGNEASMAPGAEGTPAFVATSAREPVRMDGNRVGRGIRPFEQR